MQTPAPRRPPKPVLVWGPGGGCWPPGCLAAGAGGCWSGRAGGTGEEVLFMGAPGLPHWGPEEGWLPASAS